jgi:hypothetical protein
MRGVFLLATLMAGIVSMNTSAQAACNVRGEFCGYPSWAANAFSAPRDRVPDAWLEPRVRKSYRVRRHRYR